MQTRKGRAEVETDELTTYIQPVNKHNAVLQEYVLWVSGFYYQSPVKQFQKLYINMAQMVAYFCLLLHKSEAYNSCN